MKNYVKIFLIAVLSVCLLVGCGKTPQQKLAGYWEKTEGRGFDYLEFFEGGKYVSDHTNYEGEYSISDDRLWLEGVLVDAKVYTYSVSGDSLTFYDDGGEVWAEYERTK